MTAVIYKILSPDLLECYVGSTIDEVNRKKGHKCSRRNNCSSHILFDKYGYDNCKFVVMEVCLIEERREKEQWWLDHSVGSVNSRRALRTKEQLKEDKHRLSERYTEYRKEYDKVYYQANKQKIADKVRAWREAQKNKI